MVAGGRVGDEGRALRQDSWLLGGRCRDVQRAALGRLALRLVAEVVGQGGLEGCWILEGATKRVTAVATTRRRRGDETTVGATMLVSRKM